MLMNNFPKGSHLKDMYSVQMSCIWFGILTVKVEDVLGNRRYRMFWYSVQMGLTVIMLQHYSKA